MTGPGCQDHRYRSIRKRALSTSPPTCIRVSKCSPAPARSLRLRGSTGWWFRELPTTLGTSGCAKKDGLTLLYTGISPKKPPASGGAPSRQTLRTRIKTHYTGDAAGSTLRLTLGILLAEQLGIALRRVGSGDRLTFHTGEKQLSEWMHAHALVSWIESVEPWEVGHRLITALDVPLNLDSNGHNEFYPVLKR